MRVLALTTAAITALFALSAQAQTVQASPSGGAPEAAASSTGKLADKDRIVCHTVRQTGSRMAERVCETVEHRESRLKRIEDRKTAEATRGTNPFKCQFACQGRRDAPGIR